MVLEHRMPLKLDSCMVIYFDLVFRFVKTSFYRSDHVIYRFIKQLENMPVDIDNIEKGLYYLYIIF